MKKIIVDEILDTMVLAKEVSSSSGNVLLNKGTSLSPSIGRRLKNWGIPFVYVDGEEEGRAATSQAVKSPDILKQQLDQKFEAVTHNAIMKKIMIAVLQFRLQKSA